MAPKEVIIEVVRVLVRRRHPGPVDFELLSRGRLLVRQMQNVKPSIP